MGRALTETEKKCTGVWTARFARRAHGRISRQEAMKLGRLYGRDLHWKYMSVSADKLSFRVPGSRLEHWKTYKPYWRGDVQRHLGFFFGWYGPNSGQWPGDTWVFNPGDEHGRCGGWRVQRGNG